MTSWNDIKTLAMAEAIPVPIVAGQVLQIAFLEGLYAEKDSLDVIFHGGTCIRLLHGGYRYSEDLDFCIPPEKGSDFLDSLVKKAYNHAKDLITLYLGSAEMELKKKERRKIATWWFNVLAPGERQKYRVKIEFGTYPAYSKKVWPLKLKDKFLPTQPLILSTDISELLADKINALADRLYTKERDFFDLWYLKSVLNVTMDWELIFKKMKDYHVKDPRNILKQRLKDLNPSTLVDNMKLFLPASFRNKFEINHYKEIVEVSKETIEEMLKHPQLK